MTKHLVQIARTAALCGVLGLALYLALEAAAVSPARNAVATTLGLILSLVFCVVTVPSVIAGWRAGELPGKSGPIEQRKEPVWYWSLLILEAASALSFMALAIYCARRLMA